MRHWIATVAVLGAAAAGLGCAAGAVGDAPRAQLRSYSCQHALDPPNRTISVKAVMRPISGTQKLQLKFDLLVRHEGGAGETAIHAGNLGSWLTPKNPTLGRLADDVWNFHKSVVDLDAPAVYRFRVGFRWLGADGHVLGSAVRYTKRCRQRELRPDLAVSSITVNPLAGQPNKDLYTAVISNNGATAAGPFEVLFVNGDGTPMKPRTVQRLGAFSSNTMNFVAPLCSANGAPTITADSTLEVDDLDRANNSMTATCPASPAPAG
jgi:hypothetical protein